VSPIVPERSTDYGGKLKTTDIICITPLIRFLLDPFTILIPNFGTKDMVHRETQVFGNKTARDMLTWGHYEFQQRLLMKCQQRTFYPSHVHLVSEAYTSKTCGICGWIHPSLKGDELFNYGSCGL